MTTKTVTSLLKSALKLKIASLIFTGALLASAADAAPVNMRYRFTSGETLKYRYTSETSVSHDLGELGSIFGGGEAASTRFTIDSKFNLKTIRTTPDGADVIFETTSLTILQDGTPVGTITEFPDGTNEARAHMKANGEVVFYKILSVIIHDSVPYLVIKQSDSGMTSVSTSDDNISVSVAGLVMEGGFREEARRVDFEESDTELETTPKQIAQFFEIPTGDVRAATATVVSGPGMKLSFATSLQSYDPQSGIGTLKIDLSTEGDSEGMGLGSAMALSISANAKLVFDCKKGQLREISTPNYVVSTQMMGASLKAKTKMSLKME